MEKISNFFFVEPSKHPQSTDKIKSRASEELTSGKIIQYFRFNMVKSYLNLFCLIALER